MKNGLKKEPLYNSHLQDFIEYKKLTRTKTKISSSKSHVRQEPDCTADSQRN